LSTYNFENVPILKVVSEAHVHIEYPLSLRVSSLV